MPAIFKLNHCCVYLPTGLYPVPPAFFIAAIPSSSESNGVVFTLLQDPPEAIAIANAAALWLSGNSATTTVS